MARPSISGFTFCRNAVTLGYPLQESIRSILPIVDEFIVAVGPSVDSTVEAVEKIGSSKVRIVESLWDETEKSDAGSYRLKRTLRSHPAVIPGLFIFRRMRWFTKMTCPVLSP